MKKTNVKLIFFKNGNLFEWLYILKRTHFNCWLKMQLRLKKTWLSQVEQGL